MHRDPDDVPAIPDDEPVPVAMANSIAEAAELTELMRGMQIPAQPAIPRDRPLQPGEPIPILVPHRFAAVATQLLDASTHRPEGDASADEIERELAAHAASGPPPTPDAEARILRPAAPIDWRRLWLLAIALAWLGWLCALALGALR